LFLHFPLLLVTTGSRMDQDGLRNGRVPTLLGPYTLSFDFLHLVLGESTSL